MVNNRRRVNYAIYEEIKEPGKGKYGETEYCVLCRRNGNMDLWGQINVYDKGDFSIVIRFGGNIIGYSEQYNVLEKQTPKFLRTVKFKNNNSNVVGSLSFITGNKEGQTIQIIDCKGVQVISEKIKSTGAMELEFSDDDEYDDKVSPWYFRRFDDPLMAEMIHNERDNASGKFKERYGVVLPGDISDEMVAILLSLPFVY